MNKTRKKAKVTIHDIAKQLNTTASTVSRALQDHPRISQAMKKAVLNLAEKLNYQPNFIASSLRKGHGNTIGIVIPRIDRNFFSSVIGGIEDVASQAGYNVLICQSYDQENKEKNIVETLINGKVDGLLISLASGTGCVNHLNQIIEKGVPLIFFDRSTQNVDASKVEIDDMLGAHMATSHLIEQGCRRIVHFSGPLNVSIYANRFKGYRSALEDHGIPYDEKLHIKDTITRDKGAEAVAKMLKFKPVPDGIFSASDFSALGAIMALKERGVRVPEDVAVVGFANEPYASMITPTLTSVDQHSREVGQAAAKLFFEELELHGSPYVSKRIILTPDLIIRESSKKLK
jgi:LacI family transcriptional regulator